MTLCRIVIGSVCGKFSLLQSKLTQINGKHGPFDLALCVGDFFGQLDVGESGEDGENPSGELDLIINDTLSLPIPVYFITGNTKLPQQLSVKAQDNHGEICKNLCYLGRRGLYITAEGLRIGFLSGSHYQAGSQHDYYTNAHVDFMTKLKYQHGTPPGVDILLTYPWPEGVSPDSKYHSSSIASVAHAAMPRYLFAAQEEKFFEREPYHCRSSSGHSGEGEPDNVRITRFIGLGQLGNADKQRWFYAMNLSPMQKMTAEELSNTMKSVKATDNPLKSSFIQLKRQHQTDQPQQHFSREKSDDRQYDRKRSKTHHDNCRQQQPKEQGPCWFCLSNPDLAQHLISSIGTEVYMTLPKGELVEDHVLIIPIEHSQSYQTISNSCRQEIDKYLQVCKKYLDEHEKLMIVWETNFRSQHLIMQVCPVDKKYGETVEQAFIDAANEEKISLLDYDECKPDQVQQYFRLLFPSGRHLIHYPEQRFNMQYPRQTLAKLLGMEDRSDWRECIKDVKEETRTCEQFKARFAKYEEELNG